MGKTARNGLYTTGKDAFRVRVLDDNKVELDAIDAIDANPAFSLEAGESTKLNKEFFETLLNDELKHYFWQKE